MSVNRCRSRVTARSSRSRARARHRRSPTWTVDGAHPRYRNTHTLRVATRLLLIERMANDVLDLGAIWAEAWRSMSYGFYAVEKNYVTWR
jgi:hypothetical protein